MPDVIMEHLLILYLHQTLTNCVPDQCTLLYVDMPDVTAGYGKLSYLNAFD